MAARSGLSAPERSNSPSPPTTSAWPAFGEERDGRFCGLAPTIRRGTGESNGDDGVRRNCSGGLASRGRRERVAQAQLREADRAADPQHADLDRNGSGRGRRPAGALQCGRRHRQAGQLAGPRPLHLRRRLRDQPAGRLGRPFRNDGWRGHRRVAQPEPAGERRQRTRLGLGGGGGRRRPRRRQPCDLERLHAPVHLAGR